MKLVRDLLSERPVLALRADATALEAARAMATHKVGCVLVTDRQERAVGIFTERDLMTRIVVPTRDANQVRLEECMTKDLYTVTPSDEVGEVRSQLQARHIRHLPVVDNGKPVCVLSLRDLLRADLEEQKEDVKAMTEYIQGDGSAA